MIARVPVRTNRHLPVAVVNHPNEHAYTRVTEFKQLSGQEHPRTTLGTSTRAPRAEFGGIALREPGVWGYSVCSTPDELARRYEDLMRAVHSIGMLAGFCYTQLADTYQEANGLLHADRTPKFPIEQIRAATIGSRRR